MWQDHPWLGVGPAHFAERFKQYRTHWAFAEPERAHNDYLDALADWGSPVSLSSEGRGCFGWGIARTLRRVRRIRAISKPSGGRYAFVLGTTGGLIALLVHSLTDFNFTSPPTPWSR
jgi:O-antigen ligase